jgi:hypothetical protein
LSQAYCVWCVIKGILEYEDLVGQQTTLRLENLWKIDIILYPFALLSHVIMFNPVMQFQSLSLQEELQYWNVWLNNNANHPVRCSPT